MNQTKRAALLFTVVIIGYMLFDYFVLRAPVDTTAQIQPNRGSARP